MSPIFWSANKPAIQRPGGIFWRVGRFARIQAAAQKATASFGGKTSFPATISVADKKAIAKFQSVALPEGYITTAAKQQTAAFSGVMKPRGIIAAEMGKAVALLMQKDLGTIQAVGKKSAVAMSAKEIERATLDVLVGKATALLNGKQTERGTIGAASQKWGASLVGHAPAPPVLDSTAGWGGQNTSDYTHTLDPAANCIVGIVGLTTSDTSVAAGDVSITLGGTSIPLLGDVLDWHGFSTTQFFGGTTNWQGCVWVFGLIGTIPTGGQTVHINNSTSGGSNTFFNIQTWSFKNALSFDAVQNTGNLSSSPGVQSVSAINSSITVQGFFDNDAVSSGGFTSYSQTQDNIHPPAQFAAASIFGHANGPNPAFSVATPSGWDFLGMAVPVNGS